MTSTFKFAASALVLTATAAFTSSTNAFAESLIKPKVAPPSVTVPGPGGSGVAGMWRLQGQLYNRFGLNVYLDKWGGGTYRAKVDGWETCNGLLSWHQSYGNKVVVNLASSRCNGPSGHWTADKMVCEAPAYSGFSAKVAPPAYGQKLSCSYIPSAYYSPTWVSLKRS